MTLTEYVRSNNISAAEFARRVNSSRQNVSRWMLGHVVPRPADIRRIQEVTDGQVTPNDFFAPARSLAEAS